MRNIIICGASRAGKTTLSRMIRKKYTIYQILSGDSIRHAYNKSIYVNQDLEDEVIGLRPPYLRFIKNYYNISINWNKDLKYILELCNLTPKQASKFADDDSIILFLGYANRTVEEIVNSYKKYDNKHDWTYNKPDEKLRKIAQVNLNRSNKYKKECKNYNIKYVDIFLNRKNKFETIMKWIEREIHKDEKVKSSIASNVKKNQNQM